MIEKFVQIIFNKPYFKLSNDVPLSYIIRTGLGYVIGLIRGKFLSFRFENVGSRLVLGSRVKLRVKSKMSMGDGIRIGENTTIDALSIEGIHFDNGVKIGANSKIIITGTMSELGKGLWIGQNTSFSENTFLEQLEVSELGQM